MRRPIAAARRTARLLAVLVTSLAALAATSLAFADGIDVSHWQGTIDWTKVDNAGVTFAFMKATEGTYYTDTQFTTNWAATKKAGILRGAYHFAQPGKSSGAAQARYFVSKVGSFKEAGTLPPVLDLEVTGGLGASALRSWVSSWLTTTEQLTGRTPILYFSPSFWEDHLGNSTAYTRYPLWIAHYTTATQPRVPGGWPTWTFWQRTSSGSVPGISGSVDMNRFNGSSAQIAALANMSGGSTAPVPAGPTLPAAAPTALTMTPAKTAAAISEPVSFRGALTGTPTTTTGTAGATTPVPNAAVSLWARSAGTSTWSKVGSGLTGTSGEYALSVPVPRSTDYKVVYAGDTTYAAATSPVVRVATPPRAVATLDLHKNRTTTVRPGTRVMVYGHATAPSGPVVGRTVRFYKHRASGGSWVYVRTVRTLSPTGWYSTTVRPLRSMTYKAVYAGDLRYTADTSNTVTVRVR